MTGLLIAQLAMTVIGGGVLLMAVEHPMIWNGLLWLTNSIRRAKIDPPLPEAVQFQPLIARPQHLTAVIITATAIGGIVGWFAIQTGWAWRSLLLSTAITVGSAGIGALGVLWYLRTNYRQTVDSAIPTAYEQVLTLMETGQPFPRAIDIVGQRLPDQHPLRVEWEWLLSRFGAKRPDGRQYMPHEICAILARQTIAPRHIAVLLRLSEAMQRPHDAQVAVVRAIVETMDQVDRRRQLVRAELAQMKASGLVITGIVGFITVFLGYSMGDRMLKAYSTPLGIGVAFVCFLCAIAPLVAGQLLSMTDDVTY